MAPKRSRSESGPQLVWRRVRGRMESGALTWNAIQSEPVQVVSRAVRALLELPDTIVAEILRLVDTGRFLKYNPHGKSFFIQQKGWSGTNRMSNRSKIMRRYNVWWDNLILGRWSGESYGEGIWIHDR